ncbi:hypothetical protein [Paraburkholderia bannensis]|uniref:hypothetical protein n=1 Tax=Paraburkholderia bannensis TaxID=765414 RepID=UPI00069504FE|nr:hypothetical protein [Paraburkholderia bannensis]
MNSISHPIYLAIGALLASAAIGHAEAQEIYVTGGTLGAGLGGALNLSPHFGIHADAEGFGLSHTVTVDDNRYDGRLTLAQGGTYLDLFPFASNQFRLTAGALFNGDSLSAKLQPNAQGNYNIGGQTVPALGPAPSAKVTLPHVMPYIGIGYGHKKPALGLGVSFDLGVAYGRPRVAYDVPSVYDPFVTDQNVIDEEQKFSDKVTRYHWYPVAQVALTYRF